MLSQRKLISVVALFLLIASVIACGATEVKHVSGERHQITIDFIKMMDEDQELERLMEESISMAAVNNPDKKDQSRSLAGRIL